MKSKLINGLQSALFEAGVHEIFVCFDKIETESRIVHSKKAEAIDQAAG